MLRITRKQCRHQQLFQQTLPYLQTPTPQPHLKGSPPQEAGLTSNIPHLHLEIARIIGRVAQLPGVDPFQAGIDAKKPVDEYGGRPVYGDGKTEIVATIFEKRGKLKLQESLDTLAKRVRESDLDNVTQEEILKRHNNPEDLRDYLGMLVLTKHPGKDGKPSYRYLPGALAYALMLEIFPRVESTRQGFVAMLPFISPLREVKELYQKANPGVQL